MKTHVTRREFLKVGHRWRQPARCSARRRSPESASGSRPTRHRSTPVKVVVWDEQQPAQKQAYANFLGNQIADHLGAQPGISVRSVSINDPGQGLRGGVLDDCQVLIWWGHVRQAEIAPETGRSIVARIKAGKLSLIALHSAHWSTPFVEAMNERTRLDVAEKLRARTGTNAIEIAYVPPPPRYTVPKADARLTPYVWLAQVPRWARQGDGSSAAIAVSRPTAATASRARDGAQAGPSDRRGNSRGV